MKVITRSYKDVEESRIEGLTQFGLDIGATKMVFDEVTEPPNQIVVYYLKDGAVWTIGSITENQSGILSAALLEPEYETTGPIIEKSFSVKYED